MNICVIGGCDVVEIEGGISRPGVFPISKTPLLGWTELGKPKKEMTERVGLEVWKKFGSSPFLVFWVIALAVNPKGWAVIEEWT